MSRHGRPGVLAPLLCLALLSFLTLPAGAQTASLVKDIVPTGPQSGASSNPRSLLGYRGKVFFLAHSVWVSDGTSHGTEMLADVPAEDSLEILDGANGYVFWVADGRLWSSDGSRAGTHPLTGPDGTLEVDPPSEARTRNFASIGSALLFMGCTQDRNYCGLWRSDGTPEGTQPVLERPWSDGRMYELTAAGGKVFFSFQGSNSGFLWVSDGTSQGTRSVKTFSGFSPPLELTAVGGRVFFIAGSSPDANSFFGDDELWVSDGTTAGTRKLTRFAPDQPFLPGLKALGSHVYFAADDVTHGDELWRSDGTEAGTVRLTDFGYEAPFGERLEPSSLALAGSRLVFLANDGLTRSDVWATSGTPQSTVALAATCHRPAPFFCSWGTPAEVASAGNRVVFFAEDEEHGREPWSTDGTPAGTRLLRDICPGACGTRDARLQPLAGAVFFAAEEGGSSRMNFWRTNGTAAGTLRWSDLAGATVGSEAAMAGPKVLFPASQAGYGHELWASDGQPGGTRLVADIARTPEGSEPYELTTFANRLFFTACSGSNRRVWQSTGTEEGMVPLEGPPGTPCSDSIEPFKAHLTAAGSSLFFWQWRWQQGQQSLELWRLDGAGAPRQIPLPSDLRPGYNPATGGSFLTLAPLGGEVYFVMSGGTGDDLRHEIRKSEGFGTRSVFSIPDGWRSPLGLTTAGGALYFFTNHEDAEQQGARIWRSDGTAAGTQPVATIAGGVSRLIAVVGSTLYAESSGTLWAVNLETGAASQAAYLGSYSSIVSAAEHGGAFFFLVWTSLDHLELWRADGARASRLVEFDELPRPYRRGSVPLVSWGGHLYFPADDGIHGMELWKTDGTAAGTAMVRDIFPGRNGSSPSSLTQAGGRLFFAARESVHGTELWQSDGTAAGTRLLQDINPGAASSFPQGFREVGGRLFFAADDGLTGSELWSLPLAGPAGCQPSSTHLCLNGGRFKVEAVWRAQGREGRGAAVPLTADTGYFWFFGADNVEVVIKVLDGRGENGHFWVFYGALSDVEYTLTVTDTQTGATSRYFNPAGQFASVGDVTGFGRLGAFSTRWIEKTAPPSPPALIAERFDPAAIAPCQAGPTRLCLNGGRFAVEASWKVQGRTDAAKAVPLTADTGYFWFFGADNVEVVVKVLDGRGYNGRFWVFYGALSDVEYTLTVTDTQTGKVKTYANPKGRFASAGDTAAF